MNLTPSFHQLSDPRIVFNPVTNQFFITWIRGKSGLHSLDSRFLNLDGTLTSAKHNFSSLAVQQGGGIVYNSAENRYLINFWNGESFDTKVLNSAGKLLNRTHNNAATSIAYHFIRNGFLFVFGTGGVRLVDHNGVKAADFAYPPSERVYRDFAVADTDSDAFFVLAQNEISNKTYFFRLGQRGFEHGSRKLVAKNDYIRNVIYNPQKHEILAVLWGLQDRFYTIRLDETGQVLSTANVAKGGASAYIDTSNVGCVFARSHYFLAYDRDETIYVKQINSSGFSASKEFVVGKQGASGTAQVGIAYAPSADRFLVYWLGTSDFSPFPSQIYGQFIQ